MRGVVPLNEPERTEERGTMSCSQGQRPAQARVQNKTLQTLSSQERMSISPPQNCSQPPYVLVPAVRIAPMGYCGNGESSLDSAERWSTPSPSLIPDALSFEVPIRGDSSSVPLIAWVRSVRSCPTAVLSLHPNPPCPYPA